MHSLHHGLFNMHFNSDLSGDVIFEKRKSEDDSGPPLDHLSVPGELVRAFVRRYMLAALNDSFKDLLYQQFSKFGGVDNKDQAFVIERIDHLKPISTQPQKDDVLHGETYLFGARVHVTFLRVFRHTDGSWVTADPAYTEELEHVQGIAASGGSQLRAQFVPGYQGEFIAYTYPYSE